MWEEVWDRVSHSPGTLTNPTKTMTITSPQCGGLCKETLSFYSEVFTTLQQTYWREYNLQGVNIDNLQLHVTNNNNEKEVVMHPNSNFRARIKIDHRTYSFKLVLIWSVGCAFSNSTRGQVNSWVIPTKKFRCVGYNITLYYIQHFQHNHRLDFTDII